MLDHVGLFVKTMTAHIANEWLFFAENEEIKNNLKQVFRLTT